MTESTEAKIARIDERTKLMLDGQNDLQLWMIRQDDRICSLEKHNNQWIGKGNAMSAITSFVVAIGTLAIALYTGLVK